MSNSPIVQSYFLNNYSNLCSSREDHFLSRKEPLAYTCQSLILILLPLYWLGGYCILRRTPTSMKPVKYSLLNWHIWCCIYDIMVTSLMTPYFFFPLLAGFPVGLFASMGVPVPFQLVLSAIICYATIFSMVSVVENRFNILPLNRHSIKKTTTKFFYYGIRVLLFTINTIFIGSNFPDQKEAVPKQLLKLPCPSKEFFHNEVFVIIQESPWREYTMALTVLTLSGEALQIVFFCAACIYFLYFTSKFCLSEKTRQMQVRFFYTAIVQIAVPVIFLLLPFIYFCFSVFTGYYNQSLNNAFIIFLPLHGLSSTIVILLNTLGSQIDVLEQLTDKDLGGLVDILCQKAPCQIPIVDTLCDVLRANLVDALTQLVQGLKAQTNPNLLCNALKFNVGNIHQ